MLPGAESLALVLRRLRADVAFNMGPVHVLLSSCEFDLFLKILPLYLPRALSCRTSELLIGESVLCALLVKIIPRLGFVIWLLCDWCHSSLSACV